MPDNNIVMPGGHRGSNAYVGKFRANLKVWGFYTKFNAFTLIFVLTGFHCAFKIFLI